MRAAGGLSFVTLLGLVPLTTVAFAFVVRFPVFQDFLKILEAFLLRYLLPASASAIVHEYVVVLAEGAARLTGLSILFVVVTASLVVDNVESEINELWGIRRKRPLMRRILVYLVGITTGPVLVGAAISLTRWLLSQLVAAVPSQKAATDAVWHVLPFTFAAIALTLLYAFAPARRVPWRHAITSGVLAALAFEAAKRGFTWYVTHFQSYEMLYGALAALPAFLVWIYLSWLVVLAGAAVTATLSESDGRGMDRS